MFNASGIPTIHAEQRRRPRQFGVALSAANTDTVGNSRAHVDEIRVTVSYTVSCD
jgi:hypothetical protein